VLPILVVLAALALAGLVFFLKKSRPAVVALPSAPSGAPSSAPLPSRPEQEAPASVATPPALLAELDALAWINAETLPAPRRQAAADVFKHVPRPPRLLQQLLSPEFINNAGMEELAELIGSEPLVATRVLASANSSLFGLATPVKNMRQAISTLGLITLRILCLQYLMIRSFKADSPERQTLLTNLWNASTLASELSQRLARAIGRPDPSRLGTLVVLSFLGRLAANAAMPRGLLATLPVGSFLERTRNEQTTLGLSAAEIGGLLMQTWDLPASLVDDVRRVDPCLVERAPDLDLALCYVCARLGERLASGDLRRLADFDLALDDTADFHRIQSRLSRPNWAALAAALRDPALGETMEAMVRALSKDAAVPA
jgi:HD-like signal output (HDOD) protein